MTNGAGATSKIANSTLASIASQLIVTQHVDAQNLTSDQLADRIQDAIKGKGK